MSTWRFDPSDRVIRLYAHLEGLEGASRVACLIFDPGASYVVLAPRVLRLLGCGGARDGLPKQRVVSAHRSEDCPVVTVPAMTVLGHRVERVECVEMDLPPGVGAEGLLGFSFLCHFRIELDYPSRCLHFHRR